MVNERENSDKLDELRDVRGEDLRKREKELDESEEKIRNNEDQFKRDSEKFFEDVEKNESKINESVNKINHRFDLFKQSASDFIRSSVKTTKDTINALDKIASSIKWKLITILIIFGILFFALYAVISLDVLQINPELEKIPIDPLLIPGIATFIGLLILIIKTNSSINSNLIRTRDNENDNLNRLHEKTGEIPESDVKIESNLSTNKRNFQDIKERLAKNIAVIQDYVPGLKEYYSGKSIKHNQEYFALSLCNALSEYRLLDKESERRLMKFSSLSQTESEWLDGITSKLSKHLQVSQLVLKICYYDYTNNETNLKDIWSLLKQDQKVDELVFILMHKFNIEPKNENKGAFVEMVSGMSPFSLKEFLKLYEAFYTDLEKEKKLVLQILRDVKFSINNQKKDEIMQFLPSTAIYDNWSKQLINKVSEVLSIDNPMLLMLVYLDYIGETQASNRIWSTSRTQDSMISSVADMFVDNRIIHLENQDTENLKNICRKVISKQSEFNLSSMESKIVEQIQSNVRIKNLIAFALEARNNPIPEKIRLDYFDKILFSGDNLEEDISEGLASKIGIKKEIILLFYYDYIQLRTERKTLYKKIIDNNLTLGLAEILIEDPLSVFNNITENQKILLVKLMHSKNDFLLDDLSTSFEFHKRLIADMNNFVDFLNEQEIKNTGNVSVEKIIEVFQNENNKSRFLSMLLLSKHIIANQQWKTMTENEMDALVFSSLVLFFTQYFDVAREESCKAASVHELTVKTLYAWMERHGFEKQFGHEKITLGKICMQVFSGDITKFNGLVDFTAELQKGVLFGSTKELAGVRFDKIDSKLESMSTDDKYRKLLEKTQMALANVMTTQISVDFIEHALTSQMISAYMITRSDGRVMPIIDDYMKDSCEELARINNDDRYKNMLILDKTSGASTRIGIIPMNIKDFGNFTTLFHNAFKHAEKKFEKDNPSETNLQFTYNLIRVIPSDLTFKHLELGGAESRENPVKTISELVKTQLGVLDRIKIAASSKEDKTPTVALQDIITMLFNKNTNIVSLVGDSVISIISSEKAFQNISNNGGFDRELKRHYNVSENTELAKTIYMKHQSNDQGTLVELIDIVSSILNKNKITISEKEINIFCKSVFDSMIDIANILYSSSSD
ncbi:hypothetical protein C6990_05415 [Nitrosopumilus sp. b3]|uniref:hypothetical protein n=1 Tax=Nitrosopumilus sp. b3 TaxID=2109909 RepID=UPI0015F6BEC9|nr:hypothetical protein [Nitrosopumilus sp. b3]KAF6247120.1 hypothetical protein C6990_05415 [Nitrosopumilus sp. b3]